MKKERIFIISNAKADLFKEYCRQLQIDTITTAYDEKNRYFSCLMTDQELSERKRSVICGVDRNGKKTRV